MQRASPVYDHTGAHVAGELLLYSENKVTFEDDNKSLAVAKALGNAKWALLATHGSLPEYLMSTGKLLLLKQNRSVLL